MRVGRWIGIPEVVLRIEVFEARGIQPVTEVGAEAEQELHRRLSEALAVNHRPEAPQRFGGAGENLRLVALDVDLDETQLGKPLEQQVQRLGPDKVPAATLPDRRLDREATAIAGFAARSEEHTSELQSLMRIS